ERRGGIASIDPADGHHRLAAGELEPGRIVRTRRGRDPAVGRSIRLQRGNQLSVRLAGVEQAADPAATAWSAVASPPTERRAKGALAKPILAEPWRRKAVTALEGQRAAVEGASTRSAEPAATQGSGVANYRLRGRA